MKSIFDEEPKTQQEIYSPTPTIKIKRWYAQVCSACAHRQHDYGEYDSVGWAFCELNKKLGNLKSFPICDAKSCGSFNPKMPVDHEFDYWELIGYMYRLKLPDNLDGKIAWSIVSFNERMGDYKTGRVE